MKEIKLTQGKVVRVDDEDYEKLNKFKWFAEFIPRRNGWYAARNARKHEGRGLIRMHRAILDAPSGLDVGHLSGDGLDNRKTNLRVCTRAQNICNNRPCKRARSKFKGVFFDNRPGTLLNRWTAQITVDGRCTTLGRFPTEEDAARERDAAALLMWGTYAHLNGDDTPSLGHLF